MGFFAYKTSDTGKTFVSDYGQDLGVPVCRRATILLPNGEKFTGTYDGYGRITNDSGETIDIFSAIMGGVAASIADEQAEYRPLRDKFFEDFEGNSKKIKIVEKDKYKFDDVSPSESCETQGFFPIVNNDEEEDDYLIPDSGYDDDDYI